MKRTRTVLVFSLLCAGVAAWAQPRPSLAPSILLVVPEQDTTETMTPVYRLSASATPGSTVTLNGVDQVVYPSGAFCGLLPLDVGENRFSIVASLPGGQTTEKAFLIIRQPPLAATPSDTLAIDSLRMHPSQDQWLDAGQILEVQCKGTPGCKATFLDGVPMHELTVEEGGGMRGIYRGTYRVEAQDHMYDTPITFRLEDSTGRVVERQSRGRISFRTSDFPLVGVTRGSRPTLYYGLGEDRLGGAALQRLNPGILLAIDGKTGDMYRVRLAEGQEAWIDNDAVSLLPAGTFPPHSLSGNWNVSGDAKYDYVTVLLDQKLPYVSSQDSDPNRIYVDVFGAVSNTNWIIQSLTTKEITNVAYRQLSKGVLRITIELKHRQLWGYAISYKGNTLTIRVKHQPERLKIKALKFVIDAGHGGDNNGALGSTGAMEKDVNLSTALHLKELLEDDGATVYLTRSSDSSVSMGSRLTDEIREDADIAISIHANSIGYTSNPADFRGVSTYYKYVPYRPLSLFILKRVMDLGLPSAGNVGSFNFLLNSPTELPNVLVEQAYMSNPLDEMKLLDDDFRKDMAKAIEKGVEDFLDSCDD
jgi:N-acetylmuramoyl-L-alanine amidase